MPSEQIRDSRAHSDKPSCSTTKFAVRCCEVLVGLDEEGEWVAWGDWCEKWVVLRGTFFFTHPDSVPHRIVSVSPSESCAGYGGHVNDGVLTFFKSWRNGRSDEFRASYKKNSSGVYSMQRGKAHI